MKKFISIVLILCISFANLYSQKFTKYISFQKFDTYVQSLNSKGLIYLFSEIKGDTTKGTMNYSAMLSNGKGSVTLKMMNISEFKEGPSKLADINTGIYKKYEHNLVFWSLTKAKQGFLYIELPKIEALLILGMQPENTQEQLEQMMQKIDCLNYFNK